MNLPSLTVRVSAIRSQNPQGRGGAIFTGVEVGDDGARIDAKAHLVVKAPHWLLNTAVEVGQFWRVTGQAEANTIVKEDIASAQVMAELCPAAVGKSAKFDGNINTLIQGYLADYSDKSMTYEKIQSDSEYKSLLNEAREAAKEASQSEQKEVCSDVLSYQA